MSFSSLAIFSLLCFLSYKLDSAHSAAGLCFIRMIVALCMGLAYKVCCLLDWFQFFITMYQILQINYIFKYPCRNTIMHIVLFQHLGLWSLFAFHNLVIPHSWLFMYFYNAHCTLYVKYLRICMNNDGMVRHAVEKFCDQCIVLKSEHIGIWIHSPTPSVKKYLGLIAILVSSQALCTFFMRYVYSCSRDSFVLCLFLI